MTRRSGSPRPAPAWRGCACRTATTACEPTGHGLRRIAEANKLLLAWSERSDDPETGECGQSNDNLRNSAYDEFHDLAKPHLQAFMAKHNPIAAQMRATTWELGAAGLIQR